MKTLVCEMKNDCTEPVTYIDDKGFVYCTGHGVERRSWRRCRKLRPHEVRKLQRGEVLHYTPPRPAAHSLADAAEAVLHQLEIGDASEGDARDIAWCARTLREALAGAGRKARR